MTVKLSAYSRLYQYDFCSFCHPFPAFVSRAWGRSWQNIARYSRRNRWLWSLSACQNIRRYNECHGILIDDGYGTYWETLFVPKDFWQPSRSSTHQALMTSLDLCSKEKGLSGADVLPARVHDDELKLWHLGCVGACSWYLIRQVQAKRIKTQFRPSWRVQVKQSRYTCHYEAR